MSQLKKNASAGYRVHFDRLKSIYDKTSTIRTHKFKCTVPENGENGESVENLQNKFTEVSKVVDSSEKGSILWFLIELYSLGFLFVSSGAKKLELLNELDPENPPLELQSLLSKIPEVWRNKIQNPTALYTFLNTTPREVYGKVLKTQKLPTGVLENLGKIFEKNQKITNANIENFPEILKISNQFTDFIIEKKDCKESEVREFFQKILFQIDEPLIENSEKTALEKKYEKLTFVIQPHSVEKIFPEIFENDENSMQKKNDIYSAYFNFLEPASKKTGRTIQSLMGVDDNQNGVSNLLGVSLKEFQKGESETKDLLFGANRLYFEKNTEILEKISAKVHALASQISDAKETDFFTGTWNNYRNLVGGRLEGWTSNFQNRLELYKTHLIGEYDEIIPEKTDTKTGEIIPEKIIEKKGEHLFIFETLEENFYIEKLFVAEPYLQDGFERLKVLRPLIFNSLEQKTVNSSQSLGEMIYEYTDLLYQLIEKLAYFQNAGLPKNRKNSLKNPDEKLGKNSFLNAQNEEKKKIKTNKKGEIYNSEGELYDERICGYFPQKYIPKQLEVFPRFIGEAGKNPEDEIKNGYRNLLNWTSSASVLIDEIQKISENQAYQKSSEILDEKWFDYREVTDEKTEKISKELGIKSQYLKTLESLKKLAFSTKNPNFIWGFFEKHIIDKGDENKNEGGWNEKYFNSENKDSHTKLDNPTCKEMWEERGESKNKKYIRFHLSTYEKGLTRFGYRIFPIHTLSYDEFIQKFSKYFGVQKLSSGNVEEVQKFFGLQSEKGRKNVKTENGEILKIYWGMILKKFPQEMVLPEFSEKFSSLKTTSLANILFAENSISNDEKFLDKFLNQKISLSKFQRFIQASVGAEIRGKLGILSHQKFSTRNVIQTTNGEQSFLEYIPLEWGEFQFTEKSSEVLETMNSRQRRRYKLAQKKLLGQGKYREKQSKNTKFSDKDILFLKNLKTPFIDFEEKSELNKKIVRHIWSVFKKETPENQKILLKLLGKIPHRWAMVLKTKIPLAGLERKTEGFFFEKSTTTCHNLVMKKQNCFLYSFPLETSKVQKQFLEKFLWGDKDNILQEKILGSTVIIEQEKQIVWDKEEPRVEEVKHKFNIFWAIPFQFEKEKTGEIKPKRQLGNSEICLTNSSGKAQKQYRKEENLLGIDLGEYGFGYAVFDPKTQKILRADTYEINEKTGEIIEGSEKKNVEISGFIEIPYLKKMRDDAADWKDTQKSGTFSHPSTGLAKIREQAAGAVRNQIHSLALKYDAIPVYEDEVDAFEIGGQRISKLYKTLKTSDVMTGKSNAADDTVRSHFWGTKYIAVGSVIGASMTSQTCRKCGVCANYEVSQVFQEDEKVEVKNGKISTKAGDVLCALDDGIYKEKSDKKKIREKIKSAQRTESVEERKSRESGKAKRGTIEQFHCQMSECQNSADCDAQAAHNIALKYYLKLVAENENNGEDFKKEEYQTEKGGFSSLKYFMEKSKNY